MTTKEQKPWSLMDEEDWKTERERVRRIQATHYNEGVVKNE